jgi:hypothetical protein
VLHAPSTIPLFRDASDRGLGLAAAR